MYLAKKLLVCRKCGARNPDHAFECRSCSSRLRGSPINDSSGTRDKLAPTQLVDSIEGDGADEPKSIWQTEYRGRIGLNLFLIVLFAFILAMNLSTGASSLNIAVVVVFLALSTTRFLYTWRKIRQGQLAS